MTPLPIDAHLQAITDALRASRSLVLVAPPGAGKTTRVPPAILRAALLSAENPNLVMLQPRRVAARASAERIAEENRWSVGREVGYHVRFDKRVGRDTRLRVLTEGILTRQLLDDPFLEGVGCVLLDEFHERNLNTDIAIALLREVQQTVRDDLILVVMSATLAAEPVAKYLGDCPIVRTEGRTFPIDISYTSATSNAWLDDQVANALEPALAKDEGDVLVFLPGAEEIRRTQRRLEGAAQRHGLLVLPLYGALPLEEQNRAIRPSGQRKIVLATNIAETSLTIDGVTTVIDTGLARVASYDAERGLDRLELQRISNASATQRAGRAGRTAPGQCLRLWTQRQQQDLQPFDLPEIRRVDLSNTVLAMHAWGKADPRTFNWFEAPEEFAIASAERLLAMLGALTSESNGAITPLGQRMLAMPAHPRLSRLLIAGIDAGLVDQAAAMAALMSEKDIVQSERGDRFAIGSSRVAGNSDLLVRLDLLDRVERERFSERWRDEGVDLAAARQVAKARDEFLRIAGRESRDDSSPALRENSRDNSRDNPGDNPNSGGRGSRRAGHVSTTPARQEPRPPGITAYPREADESELLRLILCAYPDRVCRRRTSDLQSASMVGGGGVRLAPESVVVKPEYFVALDARHDERSATRQAIVKIASAVDPAWLDEVFPQSVRREREVVFDESLKRVVGRGTLWYRDLLLREDRSVPVDPQLAADALANALAPRVNEIFASNESAAGILARLDLLRRAMPEHPWPAIDPAGLVEMLRQACVGKRTEDDVRHAPLGSVIKNLLTYPLDRLFDQHAPESVTVPTGNRIKLQYTLGQSPVLAVRLQEMFGQLDTPRVAGGRVPVTLHLLGPNYRPVQITGDLKSFWANTYFQVRKDLKVKYPKHAWPDDPIAAPPVAKGRPRM